MNPVDTFLDAIEPVGPNYLGDLRVVDTLVRGFIKAVLDAENPENAIAAADSIVSIFLGADRNFVVVRGWNTKEGLGLYVADHYSKVSRELPFEEILRILFYSGVKRILIIANFGSKNGREAMKEQINEFIEEYVALLTHTWGIRFPEDRSLFGGLSSSQLPQPE